MTVSSDVSLMEFSLIKNTNLLKYSYIIFVSVAGVNLLFEENIRCGDDVMELGTYM